MTSKDGEYDVEYDETNHSDVNGLVQKKISVRKSSFQIDFDGKHTEIARIFAQMSRETLCS